MDDPLTRAEVRRLRLMAHTSSGHGRRKKTRTPMPEWVWIVAMVVFLAIFTALISWLAISVFYDDASSTQGALNLILT
jgi:hypothetical protein